MAELTEKEKMVRGELYYAFTPELIAARERAQRACAAFNEAKDATRRRKVELWREILADPTPLPPPAPTPTEDALLFRNDPIIEPGITLEYGFNLRVGAGAYINANCLISDICPVTIGARTLIGPNVCLYGAAHPLDPRVRDGTRGPELGREISVGEDCWVGGSAVLLPGVRVGRGAVVGAGSVVTKDVPPFHVVAGNPARIIRKIESEWEREGESKEGEGEGEGEKTQ